MVRDERLAGVDPILLLHLITLCRCLGEEPMGLQSCFVIARLATGWWQRRCISILRFIGAACINGVCGLIWQVPVVDLGERVLEGVKSEVRILAALAHEHIVKYRGAYQHDGHLAILMECGLPVLYYTNDVTRMALYYTNDLIIS